ncbi:hypothetical protein P7C70_g4022, partial [Phenoliferia sp. Uapishka_3]
MVAPLGPFCARARSGSLSCGRSSYPKLDPTTICNTTPPPTPPASVETAFSYLPPGLGLTVKGASAIRDARDDYEVEGRGWTRPGVRTIGSSRSHTNANGSRKSSDSSNSSSSEGTSADSPASSTLEDVVPPRRKDKAWLAAGEDPGLGAARRALWEDPVEPIIGAGAASVGERDQPQHAGAQRKTLDESDGDEESDYDYDIPILPPVPTPSQPSHATLPP